MMNSWSPEPAPQDDLLLTPSLSDPTIASRRILLVDDSSSLRKLITDWLVQYGAKVSTAANGLQAVEMVHKAQEAGQPFDLILMDVVMPELNGCEATWRLRHEGYTGRIVILTAADQHFDLARSLIAGADDYLAKPFTPADLALILAQYAPSH